jgi:hypothetical protein
MKKYYKDNQIVVRPKSLVYKGKTYLNPSDEVLIEAGYEIKEEEIVTPPVTNESIKRQRQMAYRMRADQYLLAYQAYTELGEHEKAAEMKELWI